MIAKSTSETVVFKRSNGDVVLRKRPRASVVKRPSTPTPVSRKQASRRRATS